MTPVEMQQLWKEVQAVQGQRDTAGTAPTPAAITSLAMTANPEVASKVTTNSNAVTTTAAATSSTSLASLSHVPPMASVAMATEPGPAGLPSHPLVQLPNGFPPDGFIMPGWCDALCCNFVLCEASSLEQKTPSCYNPTPPFCMYLVIVMLGAVVVVVVVAAAAAVVVVVLIQHVPSE